MKIVYFFKKLVGLNTHYEDMLMMHTNWTIGPGIVGKISAKITSMLPSGLASFGGGAGTAPAVPIIVTKVSVAGLALLTAAEISFSTAETITTRTNQARAVIADTLAHPINLDKALNPAYHGKRKEMNDNLLLTAEYYSDELGEDYQITPYAGYRQYNEDFVGLFNRQYDRNASSGSGTSGNKDNLVVPSEYSRDSALIKQVDTADDLRDRYNLLAEREDFIGSLNVADFTNNKESLSLGGLETIGGLYRTVPVVTEEGIHGVEITATVSRVLQVLHDGTVLTENYTTTIKQQAFSETSYQYLVSLFNGNLVGPVTYVNTLTTSQGKKYTLTPQSSFLERITGVPNYANDYYRR